MTKMNACEKIFNSTSPFDYADTTDTTDYKLEGNALMTYIMGFIVIVERSILLIVS